MHKQRSFIYKGFKFIRTAFKGGASSDNLVKACKGKGKPICLGYSYADGGCRLMTVQSNMGQSADVFSASFWGMPTRARSNREGGIEEGLVRRAFRYPLDQHRSSAFAVGMCREIEEKKSPAQPPNYDQEAQPAREQVRRHLLLHGSVVVFLASFRGLRTTNTEG